MAPSFPNKIHGKILYLEVGVLYFRRVLFSGQISKCPFGYYFGESPMQNANMTRSSFLMIIFICTLFGGNGVAIKYGLTRMGPFTSVGIRFFIAALSIFIWAQFSKIPLKPTGHQMKLSLVHCILFTFQLAFFHLGFQKTTASHGALVANVLPFVVMVLAHFFIPGDKITLKKSLGILLGFTGVVLLFMDDPDLSGDIRQGDFIILGAVLCWSISAVYVKCIISQFNPVQLTWYPMVFCLPFYWGAALFFETPSLAQWDATSFCALFYQAILAGAYAMGAWNIMLNKYGATALHTFIFIIPLVGVLSGVVMLNEPVTPHLIASVVSIVTGIMVVNFTSKKKHLAHGASGL